MEANIIYRIVKGDKKAFDAFMDYYSSTLYRCAFGVVGTRESAEEVVSDVFFEVWKNRLKLLEIESMEAFLRTITYRKAISYLRHEDSMPARVSLDDIENFTVAPIAAPDSEMISREELDAVRRAIDELPPKCRHVFYLAKIERIPYKEIAQTLSITVATINYHVAYAMDALRKRLGPLVALLAFLYPGMKDF